MIDMAGELWNIPEQNIHIYCIPTYIQAIYRLYTKHLDTY